MGALCRVFAFVAFLACCVSGATCVYAQSSTSTPSITMAGKLDGVAIGEPIAGLRDLLGDPIKIDTIGATTIWRYLTHGGGTYLDIIVKNNTVQSLTLLRRFNSVSFDDPNGISFGATPDQVRTKLGSPTHESTNSDDGSLDLWYAAGPYAWVYEFNNDVLGFIQLVASRTFRSTLSAGPPIPTFDGSSIESAIWIRPSNILFTSVWIQNYFAINTCGTNGRWNQGSSRFQSAPGNLMAYTIVSATCSAGGPPRDFYFNTNGDTRPIPNNNTIYVDVHQLRQMIPTATPSGSPAPSPSPTR